MNHKCENCGCLHKVKAADLKRGWGKTCSCAASIKARKPNSNYKKFRRVYDRLLRRMRWTQKVVYEQTKIVFSYAKRMRWI